MDTGGITMASRFIFKAMKTLKHENAEENNTNTDGPCEPDNRNYGASFPSRWTIRKSTGAVDRCHSARQACVMISTPPARRAVFGVLAE